jgi:uncharacterized protein (TIGR03067 family)
MLDIDRIVIINYLSSMRLSILLFACLSIALKANSQTNSLNGAWVPVTQEIGGFSVPNILFEKQKLILRDSTYTVIAESVDKGIVKYTGDKMDIYGNDGVNAGKHFTAIYKLENGLLTICYNLKGEEYPEIFDSHDKPMYFLSVFKRE